jgi:hypothetical protein
MEITAESPSTSPTVTRCICEELAGCVMQPRREAPSRGLAPLARCRALLRRPRAGRRPLRSSSELPFQEGSKRLPVEKNECYFPCDVFFASCRADRPSFLSLSMAASLSRALRASRPVSSLLSRQAPVLAVRSLRAAAPVQSSVPTVTTDNGTVGKRCPRRRCSIAGRYPGLRCAGLSRGDRACLPESDRSLASRRRPQSPSTSSSTLIHLPITWRRCATPTPPTARSTTR